MKLHAAQWTISMCSCLQRPQRLTVFIIYTVWVPFYLKKSLLHPASWKLLRLRKSPCIRNSKWSNLVYIHLSRRARILLTKLPVACPPHYVKERWFCNWQGPPLTGSNEHFKLHTNNYYQSTLCRNQDSRLSYKTKLVNHQKINIHSHKRREIVGSPPICTHNDNCVLLGTKPNHCTWSTRQPELAERSVRNKIPGHHPCYNQQKTQKIIIIFHTS